MGAAVAATLVAVGAMAGRCGAAWTGTRGTRARVGGFVGTGVGSGGGTVGSGVGGTGVGGSGVGGTRVGGTGVGGGGVAVTTTTAGVGGRVMVRAVGVSSGTARPCTTGGRVGW